MPVKPPWTGWYIFAVTADLPEELDAVIRRLQAAYEEARALTTAIDEPQAGFAAATHLSEALQAMLDEVAEFRALIMARIYEAEPVDQRSLMKLGKRFGISKSRADQLVQRGKAAHRKDQEEQP